MDTNRKTAYYTLMDVDSKRAYSNLALKHHIILCKPDSAQFVRELVYGVLENKLYLDYIISHFLKTPIEKVKRSDLIVLRMGIYQIGFMNSVPEYAAVNESVLLAKRFCLGRDGFINGVLRSYIRGRDTIELPKKEDDKIRYLSVKYSYEPWIIEKWLDVYELDFVEELLAAGNKTPDFVVRTNTLKIAKEDLKDRLMEKGCGVKDGVFCDESLHVKGSGLLDGSLYRKGLFSVQDDSSMLVVDMLNPQPDETIIDVCAAPGGKTLFIAERMRNRGMVHAWDIYRRKLALIDQEAKRLGISIIQTRTWDGTRTDSIMAEKADKVLVDAPCSGLGVIRHKPEIKYKKETSAIRELPRKQLDILNASAKYVKPGGILVYSTCTINAAENQKVIKDFLKKNPTFEKLEQMQLFPNVSKTDGFFICKMRKAELLDMLSAEQ